MYDVIVIGGGPSGCAASRRCAELGLKTLMVDRKIEIGSPLKDYEIISRNGMESLGVAIEKHWLDLSLTKIQITFETTRSSITLDDMEICSIEADKFGKHLAALSSHAGADILIKTEAISPIFDAGSVSGVMLRTGQTSREEKSRVVIFAGGLDSSFLQTIPELTSTRKESVARSFQQRIVGDFGNRDTIDIYPDSDLHSVLAVIPKGDNTANVIVITNDDSIDPILYISNFINSTLALKKWGSIQDVSTEIYRMIYPVKLGVAGLILAGDSTGINCNDWIMGIENAYLSGIYAADAAKRMIETGTFHDLSEYEKKITSTSRLRQNGDLIEKISKLDENALKNKLLSDGNLHFHGHGSLLDILGSFFR